MSLTSMAVRRVRKLLAWALAVIVVGLLVVGALAVALAVTGSQVPSFMVMV